MPTYQEFIEQKSQLGGNYGFDPLWMPDFLYDFQKSLVEWSLRKGKAAIFADCGLGKSPMSLVWGDNVRRKTNKPVLLLTPLAVGPQFEQEGEKFGVECKVSRDGTVYPNITITNYERLGYFKPDDFSGVVLDESSILKSFSGVRRGEITDFMRKTPYRLLCTATAAPNDYIELGTLSEALGELGYMDMLNRFFKNTNNTSDTKGHWRGSGRMTKNGAHLHVFQGQQWRFKGHAEIPFWRWVCSWARAIRKPSDLGYDDGPFILPPLIEKRHISETRTLGDGMLFAMPAVGLHEQREERKRTIRERCEMVASLVDTDMPALVWCHLNPEGDLLDHLIPDGQQISGKHSDDQKEARFQDFINGKLRVLITKPKIGAWGLNLQHCNHIVYFPSHSYEQYYQGVRRCWRFGQKKPVTVDLVMTEGDEDVMANMQRKSKAADSMFSNLVNEMNNVLTVKRELPTLSSVDIPSWV